MYENAAGEAAVCELPYAVVWTAAGPVLPAACKGAAVEMTMGVPLAAALAGEWLHLPLGSGCSCWEVAAAALAVPDAGAAGTGTGSACDILWGVVCCAILEG